MDESSTQNAVSGASKLEKARIAAALTGKEFCTLCWAMLEPENTCGVIRAHYGSRTVLTILCVSCKSSLTDGAILRLSRTDWRHVTVITEHDWFTATPIRGYTVRLHDGTTLKASELVILNDSASWWKDDDVAHYPNDFSYICHGKISQ